VKNDSDANASRERDRSSLPDLIRQSMRRLNMDHRIKPGGDETVVGGPLGKNL
jgi:hypothetical protein